MEDSRSEAMHQLLLMEEIRLEAMKRNMEAILRVQPKEMFDCVRLSFQVL
jgi:hypothetical protein